MTTLNWQTEEHRIKYQYCLLVFKVLNNLAPPYLEPLKSRFNPSYCTRYSLNSSLSIPHPKTDFKNDPFHTLEVLYTTGFPLQYSSGVPGIPRQGGGGGASEGAKGPSPNERSERGEGGGGVGRSFPLPR